MTSAHSRQPKEIGQSTSSAAGSPAKISASQARGLALPVQGPVFGTRCTGLLARYDRDSCLWRTLQRCLAGGWEPYSATFPRSGMTRNGTLSPLQPLVRRTGGKGSGSWPTPNASAVSNSTNLQCSGDGRTKPNKLGWAVAMWPTPSASQMPCEGTVRIARQRWLAGDATLEEASAIAGRDVRDKQGKVPAMLPTPRATDGSKGSRTADGAARELKRGRNIDLGVAIGGGQLNPTWVEWLMGFPLGWTDCEDSETQSYRKSSS